MAKISDIKLPELETKTIDVAGIKVVVNTKMNTLAKRSLILATVDNATDEQGMISDFLLQMAFDINIIKLYTDIEWEEDDIENVFLAYDRLIHSGIIDAVIQAMGKEEYDMLFEGVYAEVDERKEFRKTFGGSIANVIYQLKNSEELLEQFKETINSFDKSKVESIVGLAEATGYNGQ